MAIENAVSSDFDPRLSIVKSVFDCRRLGVVHIVGFSHAAVKSILRIKYH